MHSVRGFAILPSAPSLDYYLALLIWQALLTRARSPRGTVALVACDDRESFANKHREPSNQTPVPLEEEKVDPEVFYRS